MGTVRIQERVSAPFAGTRVDVEAGVISGASICGTASKNGNDYSRESFGDLRQYEGRHVYLNHEASRRERRAEDKIGWFENVRFRESTGTPEGDFHVLKSHPMAGAVLEAAQRNPGLFGFSHVAHCRLSRGAGGRTRVEAVEQVESIDLVSTPATTRSIFEGAGTVGTTLGQLVESVEPRVDGDRRKALRRWLVEMDGDVMLDAPAGDMPADSADPDEALWSGFTAAITAILEKYKSGEMDAAAAGKEVGRYVKGHAKLTGNGKAEEKGGEKSEPKEPDSESVRLRSDLDRLVRENIELRAKAAGVELDDVRRGVLAKVSESERVALIESWRKPKAEAKAPDPPRSSGRMSAAELLGKSSKVSEGGAPDAKAFAASIRN